MTAQGPGWYVDEQDPSRERYFNGGSWSRQTRPLRGEPRHFETATTVANTDDDVDNELVWLSTETFARARSLHRYADALTWLMVILSALGYLGCVVIGVTQENAAGVAEAVGLTLGITVQLVVVLFFVAWARTYSLDTQRRVQETAS